MNCGATVTRKDFLAAIENIERQMEAALPQLSDNEIQRVKRTFKRMSKITGFFDKSNFYFLCMRTQKSPYLEDSQKEKDSATL